MLQTTIDILRQDYTEHLQHHIMSRLPRPTIVFKGFRGITSEIVDGNHTYVAMATMVAIAERGGLRLPSPPSVPEYIYLESTNGHVSNAA